MNSFGAGLEGVKALTGLSMVGGGRKKKRSSTKRRKSGRKIKMRKAYPYRLIPKRYKMGFFGGNQKYLMCTEVTAPGPAMQPSMQGPPKYLPPKYLPTNPQKLPDIVSANGQVGGARMKMAIYKKKLDNLNVEKLQKIATRKGVKITKKKNGKTVYLKKSTLVRKICECKMGRRMKKRSKSSRKY